MKNNLYSRTKIDEQELSSRNKQRTSSDAQLFVSFAIHKLMLSFIFLGIFLVAIASVSAEVRITSPLRSMYNRGETIPLEGYIVTENVSSASLLVALQCNNQTILTSNYTFAQQTQKITFRELGVVPLTIPSTVQGRCNVKVNYREDYDATQFFEITPELLGRISVNKRSVRLGDLVTVEGFLYRQDGTDVTADGDLFFVSGSKKYSLTSLTFKDGKFVYETSLTHLLNGSYTFELVAHDPLGNYLSTTSQSVEVVTLLPFTITSDNSVYSPSEEAEIKGTLDSVYGANDEKVTVQLELNNATYTTIPRGISFSFFVSLPSTIRSGTHTLRVTATDSYGNSGQQSLAINITAQPTVIELVVPQQSFAPEDIFNVTAFLYDQAHELIDAQARLMMISPTGTIILNTEVSVNSPVTLQFPQFSPPGNYLIRVRSGSLTAEKSLVVQSVKNLTYIYINKTIVLKNVGNVEYKDIIHIALESGDHITPVEKEVNLKPGATQSIPLEEEVSAGTYNVVVDATPLAKDISLEDKRSSMKKITGNVVGTTGLSETTVETGSVILGWLIVIILLGVVGWVVYNKQKAEKCNENEKRKFY